jgi:hypothetical protein
MRLAVLARGKRTTAGSSASLGMTDSGEESAASGRGERATADSSTALGMTNTGLGSE